MAKESKKKNKSFSLKTVLLAFIIIATFLLSNAYVRKEIKSLIRKIDTAEKVLQSKRDRIETLFVEVQKLSTEERIVKIAQDSLGLIRATEEFDKININKQKLEQIENIINLKYD